MLISIVCLLVLILGFLTIISFKRNPLLRISAIVNKFFIIFFLLSVVKFFINGITPFVEESNFKIVLNLVSTSLLVTLLPFFYFYIAELYIGYKISKRTIGHFLSAFFILLVAVYYFFTFNRIFFISIKKAIVFIALASTIFYGVLIFRLIKRNKFRLESDVAIIQQHNKIIKIWSYFLFSFYCISCLISGFTWILVVYFQAEILMNFFYVPSMFTWIIIFSILLTNPEFIQRYNSLNLEIDKLKPIQLNTIWITNIKPFSISSIKDQKLAEKVYEQLMNYLQKIEQEAFFTEIFRNPTISIEDLSLKIEAPLSHINYVFKYHSSVSFNEFKKIVRIQDAISLMKTDFLKTNTIEALAMKVGFSSYTPFYSSFKSIEGISPQEYIKQSNL